MNRERHIHQARTYLSEARQRRNNPADRNFCWRLLLWAAACRRRATAVRTEPAQGALFQ